MASNYDSNGEHNKQHHYQAFCTVLAKLMHVSGRYPRLAAALQGMLPRTTSAKTQEQWIDLVYSAYARWSRRPLTRHEAERRFGVCA